MGERSETNANANVMVFGSGVRVRRYPSLAIGVALTGAAGAFTYGAAAVVRDFAAVNTIKANWRFYGLAPFTPATLANEYFIALGFGAGAGATALTNLTANCLMEVAVSNITVATGAQQTVTFPYAPTVLFDGVTDAALGNMANTGGGAVAITCAAMIATGFGT